MRVGTRRRRRDAALRERARAKARVAYGEMGQLASSSLPVIAALRGGGFFLITKVTDDKVVVVQPLCHVAEPLNRAEFETAWDGRLVVMTRRGSLSIPATAWSSSSPARLRECAV